MAADAVTWARWSSSTSNAHEVTGPGSGSITMALPEVPPPSAPRRTVSAVRVVAAPAPAALTGSLTVRRRYSSREWVDAAVELASTNIWAWCQDAIEVGSVAARKPRTLPPTGAHRDRVAVGVPQRQRCRFPQPDRGAHTVDVPECVTGGAMQVGAERGVLLFDQQGAVAAGDETVSIGTCFRGGVGFGDGDADEDDDERDHEAEV